MDAPKLEFAERTDPGRDPEKQVNEDSSASATTPFGFLSVVCDGMGGHAGGAEASQLAIATILEVFKRTPVSAAPRDALTNALEEANARVCTMPSADRHARPGSTAVAILLHEEGAEVAHVGDSRCYLLHSGQVVQVTKDHSMVQQLVDAKVLTQEQAENHPDANVITRALGMGAEVEVETRPEPVPFVDGDVFILCSDGLCDLVKPKELLEIAEKGDVEAAAKQLVDLANERGGHDNITVQIVRVRSNSKASREVKATAVQSTTEISEGGALRDTWGRVPRATPVAPQPMISVIPPIAPVPKFSNHPPSGEPDEKARTSVAIGIGLAAVGILIAIIVLYLEMSRRGGGHQDHVPAVLPSSTPAVVPTQSSAPPTAPPTAPATTPPTEIAPISGDAAL